MELVEFGTEQGHLKAGFFGKAGSGKTTTATLLALEVYKRFGCKGPLYLFDTENTAAQVALLSKKHDGPNVQGVRGRSMKQLLDLAKQVPEGGVLLVDSITHVWHKLMADYQAQMNRAREAKGLGPVTRLQLSDWMPIKDHWKPWADWFLNSPAHIIVCGRLGNEWAYEEHEQSSGDTYKELVKAGTKMKAEGEFGYEPSLLVEMDLKKEPLNDARSKFKQFHRATVVKDRFFEMDGAEIDDPTGESFATHLDRLNPAAHSAVDTNTETDMGVNSRGESERRRERREREILCEEIQGVITSRWPGQSKGEKKAKTDALEAVFGTRSWKAVERMNSGELRVGLDAIVNLTKQEEGA